MKNLVASGRVDKAERLSAVVYPRCSECHAPNPQGLLRCSQCYAMTPGAIDLGVIAMKSTNRKEHWLGQIDIWRRLIINNRNRGKGWLSIAWQFARGGLSWN